MSYGDDILFWAFRYALPRNTYAVDDVADAILRSTGAIRPKYRRIMLRELRDDRDEHGFDTPYAVKWHKVIEALEKEEEAYGTKA